MRIQYPSILMIAQKSPFEKGLLRSCGVARLPALDLLLLLSALPAAQTLTVQS